MAILRLKPGAISLLVFAWFFWSPVAAGIVNRTIDDSVGDSQTLQLVTYLPSTGGVWKDETCIGCAINPDVSQTFKGTYTAATYNPDLGSINATMKFNGTAIYVFFVLANNAGDGITTLTLANFTLDGNPPKLFQHAPDLTTTAFQYNQLVFSQTNLINAEHTLVISTSGVDTNVYVDFDYAIYTHDDDAPLLPLPTAGSQTTTTPATTSQPITTNVNTAGTTKTPPNTTTSNVGSATTSSSELNQAASSKSQVSTGAIAGGVVGGLVVLALLILFFLLRRRRKNHRNISNEEGADVLPAMTQFDHGSSQHALAISPFNTQPIPPSTTSVPLAGTQSPSSLSYMPYTGSLDILSAYGGVAESNSGSLPYLSGSEARTSSSDPNGRLLPVRRGPPQQLSVTNGNDASTVDDDDTAVAALTTPSSLNDVDRIRRTRQNELDQQLRTVQQEMMHLTSDLNNGEKGMDRRSVRRQRTLNRGASGAEGNEEEEMSMSDMKEQLRMLREQIAYLQDQQRSAWAQGLSDDPPPGYTPARHSQSPPSAILPAH